MNTLRNSKIKLVADHFNKLSKKNSNTKVESIISKAQKIGMKTVTMGFPDIYGRFVGKKYDVDYYFNNIINKGSNACNYLLGCDMYFTPLPNSKLPPSSSGYGDFMMKPDINSLREINYVNGETQYLFFSDLVYIENENNSVEYAPRTLLKKANESLNKLGVNLKVECEVNFTAFHEKFRKNMNRISEMIPITEHNNLTNSFYLTNNQEFLNKISNSMKFSKIQVKSVTGDSGEGQFKIGICKSDSVEFGDNITLTKLVRF